MKKLILIALLVGLYFVPAINEKIDEFLLIFNSLEDVKAYILSFGIWAPVVSFTLMVLQALIAPLPAFLITFANAALFGWVAGALLSWGSAMVGALLCFLIANYFGRDLVKKLVSDESLQKSDAFFEKHGVYAVLIARLLPFISFDVVSYAAGLTKMRMGAFLLATGLGQLPATLVYSYAGEMLTGSLKTIVMALLLVFAFSVFIALMMRIYKNRKLAKDG